MKRLYGIAAMLALIVLFQPWSYDHRGFADSTIAVPGGEIVLSLDDHSSGKSYCLSSNFKTTDKPGEPILLAIEQIGTQSMLEVSGQLQKSGATFRIEGLETSFSYFEGPNIGRLVFPTNQPLNVIGSIQYKGNKHIFQTQLKLQHWAKSRKVIRFCV